MGQAKRELERIHSLEDQATDVLAGTGAIKSCDVHDDIYIDQMDGDAVDDARTQGRALIAAGNLDCTVEEWDTAVDSAVANTGDECPLCTKYMDD